MPPLLRYKHIDCAACYGNEAEIGEVFAEVLAAGAVKREDVFVTSKLWNSEHAAADVLPAVQKTLADLKLEYLDLYLIHWPQNFAKEGSEGNCSFPRNEVGQHFGYIFWSFQPNNAEFASHFCCLKSKKLLKTTLKKLTGSIRYDMDTATIETWTAMEALVEAGLVKVQL